MKEIKRKEYDKVARCPLHRARRPAALDHRDRQARRDRLRGPRRGRQRRRDQGDRRDRSIRATRASSRCRKPSEREATQWYFQRYVEHLPAAGELVLFDRSWYNRAGVEHVMGFCSDEQYQRVSRRLPGVREAHHRRRPDPAQVLARGRSGRAGTALRRARERSAQALEDLADRSQGTRAVRRRTAARAT